MLVLIAFISRLYGVLRSASGSNSWFPTMALVGGILMTGVRLSEIGFIYPASELDSYGEDTQVAKLLILWRWNSANLLAPPFTARLALVARFPLVYFHDGFRWAGAGLRAVMVGVLWRRSGASRLAQVDQPLGAERLRAVIMCV